MSLEVNVLDKEIFEKQLKKMDSKYVVQYSEALLHLDYLFLSSQVKSDEIENIYYSMPTCKAIESEIFPEKSKRNSPRKRKTPVEDTSKEDFSLTSREEQVKIHKNSQRKTIIF